MEMITVCAGSSVPSAPTNPSAVTSRVMNGQRKVAPSASAAARSLPNASGFWMSTSTTSCAPSR